MLNRDERYARARAWMQALASRPRAPATARPPAGSVFLDVTIEGQRFQGEHHEGTLYVRSGAQGACALGVASINMARRYSGPETWHICKYRDQATVPLQLSDAGLRTLAVVFGMPIVPQLPGITFGGDYFELEHFYQSEAFTALQAWAKKAPRRVAGLVGDNYLYLWPLSALEGAYVEKTPENVARARARAVASGGQRSGRAAPGGAAAAT